MSVSLRGVGARLRSRRPVDPETGLPRQLGRAYGLLASCVLGVLLLAVLGAVLGPRWDPQPVTDPIEVASPSTAVTGAPSLRGYRTTESIVTIALDGAVVKGRVIMPIGVRGQVPGVVFVHGAGTGRFDEAFVAQAARLATAGIATLVPDKRLDTYSVRHRDYVAMAADYARSVDVLRAWPGVDPDRVGVYAESEGGWIAPVMAAADPTIAFAALISDPVVPPRQQAAFAADQYLRNAGVPHGVFRAIPRAAGMSIPGGGFDYIDFDVRPYLREVTQPLFVAYGTADDSMPIVQGAQEILADAAGAPVTVRYYEGANHGLKVDTQVVQAFTDDLSGWVLGLPETARATPQVAGAQPTQAFLAAPVPQPRWLASGDVLLATVLGAAGLVLVPWLLTPADRLVRALWVRRRRRAGSTRPVLPGPRWPKGVAWRLAGVGFGAIATVVALVWYLLTIAKIAMDYQHNALVVQGGWLLVRALGIWVVVAVVLLGRRMLDVRAAGRRVAPGTTRLVGTWCSAVGTLTLLVVLAYWGVFQLGI